MTKKPSLAIYNPYLETKGGGEKVCLAMAEILSESYEVTLVSRKKADLKELGDYFNLDLSKCHHYKLPNPSSIFVKISNRLRFPGRLRNLLHEHEDYKKLKQKNFDVFVNNCYKSAMPNPSKKGVYMCMFPQEFLDKSGFSLAKKAYHYLMDGVERILYGKTGREIIDTYQSVTVNSTFTQGWTEKLWGMTEEQVDILYPICDDMSDNKTPKEKIILNVGRFFADSGENHYKCQDKLLAAFKEMPDLHKEAWELHFVGSVAEDIDSLKYLLKLIKDAQGYPVTFHMNSPFSELKTMYNRASIYWHGTGWGSDPEEHPEKQEHFGISTVEAMSAGAVPIVIGTAGQKEVVTPGANGFTWLNKTDLIKYTRAVATNTKVLNTVSAEAIKRARVYNKSSFKKSLSELF